MFRGANTIPQSDVWRSELVLVCVRYVRKYILAGSGFVLLVSQGDVFHKLLKLVRGGSLESILKREHGRGAADALCTAGNALHIAPNNMTWETFNQ